MTSEQLRSFAPIPLRLILGIGFVFHGWDKIADGTASFQGMLDMVGIPGGAATAWLVALLEFGGGLMLLAGVLIPLISAALIANMLVAMVTVHLPSGFSFMNMTGMGPDGPTFGMPGYEVNLLYVAGLATLILTGAGAYSVGSSRTSLRDESHTTSPRPDNIAGRT